LTFTNIKFCQIEHQALNMDRLTRTRSFILTQCVILALIVSVNGFVPRSSVRPSSLSSTETTSKPSITLRFLRNSDRAHYERSLEEMMDNDWRVFRAKLVAQEQQMKVAAAAATPTQAGANSSKGGSTKPHLEHRSREKMTKQGQLGDLFVGAITSIFNNNSNNNSSNNNNNHANNDDSRNENKRMISAPIKFPVGRSSRYDRSIFEGDTIAGIVPAGSSSVHHPSFSVHDPFCSPDELPILIPSTSSVTINKHRWAHPISHIETGCVLIANEKLGGVFHQTIVLIIEHHEHAGTLGVVINRYVSHYTMI
jgi:putative transcriptional regulator